MDGAYRLDGRSAVVISAANGIGRACAIAFAAAGARVIAADLDEANAEATAELIRAEGGVAVARRVDARSPEDLEALVARAREAHGGLDVLLYGAAMHDVSGTVLDITPEHWDEVLRVNLTGAFLACRAALPAMIEGGGGSIVLIASQLGSVAAPARAGYCASKGGLIQFAKVVAADHAAQSVRVNTLSPGAVETDRLTRRFGDMGAARAALGAKHLLGRLGLPVEIAHAALFLASDASSFMTGADLVVDGGYTAI